MNYGTQKASRIIHLLSVLLKSRGPAAYHVIVIGKNFYAHFTPPMTWWQTRRSVIHAENKDRTHDAYGI